MPVRAMIRIQNGLIIDDDSAFDTGGEPCQP